jgi:hypothetical protein
MVAFDYSFHVSTSYPTVFEQWKELNSDYDAHFLLNVVVAS